MEIAAWARRQIDFLFTPHEAEKNGLKNVLGIHDASGDAVSGPEDVVMMLSIKEFDLIWRTGYCSEVFNGLHSFLLHFVSSHKTPFRGGLLTDYRLMKVFLRISWGLRLPAGEYLFAHPRFNGAVPMDLGDERR
jgi:hypothetical protein